MKTPESRRYTDTQVLDQILLDAETQLDHDQRVLYDVQARIATNKAVIKRIEGMREQGNPKVVEAEPQCPNTLEGKHCTLIDGHHEPCNFRL